MTIFSFAAKFRGRFAANHSPAPKRETDMNHFAKIANITQPEHGSSLWLNRVIAEAKSPRLEIVTMTPQLAKTLLDLNPDNRSIRQTKVQQYASDMAAGRWVLNGEPIIVANDGRLNDGQHRCLAVIEANTPVAVAIMFGIERETRLTVDQGGARTAGDFLNMEGVPNGSLAASIARMAIAYEKNDGRTLASSNFVTSAEIRDRVYNDTALAASVTFGNTNANYSRQFAAGSLIGFSHYVLSKINAMDAELFLTRVCRGDGLRLRDPAHTLREKLLGGRLSRDRKVKLILQAWNFHRRGMKVSAGSMNSELPFPALV